MQLHDVSIVIGFDKSRIFFHCSSKTSKLNTHFLTCVTDISKAARLFLNASILRSMEALGLAEVSLRRSSSTGFSRLRCRLNLSVTECRAVSKTTSSNLKVVTS